MKLGVVGSINVDLVYQLKDYLKKGETAIGYDFQTLMGGKGANQAIMMKALHDDVVMLGAVGSDDFGKSALQHLASKGLITDYINEKNDNTGIAIIQLVNHDNSIAVIPGANMKITCEEVDAFLNKNPDLSYVVLQLEINMDAISYLIRQCHERKIPVILNPAPAQTLDHELIDLVDYLIPNETEAELLFQSREFEKLVKDYRGKLIITMGSEGVMYYDGVKAKLAPAQKISVVDTTGAGDSFVAGFATGLAKQYSMEDSVNLGIQVASMTCSCMGAQGAFDRVRSDLYEKIRNS